MSLDAKDKEPLEDRQHDSSPTPGLASRNKSGRRINHWAFLDPDNYVCYPRLEPLSYMNEARLIRRAQSGDKEARNTVWLHYARLAFSVVNQFRIPDHLLADAIQEGSLGIIKAIEKFDIDKYNSFSTYAWRWMYQRIQRFVIENVFPVRPPVYLYRYYASFRRDLKNTNAPGHESEVWNNWRQLMPQRFQLLIRFHVACDQMPLQDVAPHHHPATYSIVYDDSPTLRSLCERVMTWLNSRDRYIISRRFGFNDEPCVTLEEIGQALNLTRERVRQLQEAAQERIRERLSKYRALLPNMADEPIEE